MNPAVRSQLLGSRLHGGWALVTAAVRIVAGALFVTFSIGKFADHAMEVVDFRRYGIPAADAAVFAVGILELVGGVLLCVGLMTRPAAILLAANMVGAIATAGRVEGGSFHLGVGPALLITMVFVGWAGAGAASLDARLLRHGTLAP